MTDKVTDRQIKELIDTFSQRIRYEPKITEKEATKDQSFQYEVKSPVLSVKVGGDNTNSFLCSH